MSSLMHGLRKRVHIRRGHYVAKYRGLTLRSYRCSCGLAWTRKVSN